MVASIGGPPVCQTLWGAAPRRTLPVALFVTVSLTEPGDQPIDAAPHCPKEEAAARCDECEDDRKKCLRARMRIGLGMVRTAPGDAKQDQHARPEEKGE